MANLNLEYKTRYGLDFPTSTTDEFVDLTLAKHWREEPYCNGNLLAPEEHYFKAIRTLFTAKEFCLHPWAERMIRAWCHDTEFLLVGSAASGKSNTIGLLAVLDWITDPSETNVTLASTDKIALAVRTYESVQRYHRILKHSTKFTVPGQEAKSVMSILNRDDSEQAESAKASIRGVAVRDGTEDEATGRLQGAHLPYMRLIADELSQMRQAVLTVRSNLSIGCINWKFCGMCNPNDRADLAMRNFSPKNGWGSVNIETEMWETLSGSKVYRFDGRWSPAVVEEDGARKYPFLIKQSDIDARLNEAHGNWDDRSIYTFVYGFPPGDETQSTILTSKEISAFNMGKPVVWTLATEVVAGLDPAFTSGGDDCRLTFGRTGVSADTAMVTLGLGDSFKLKIEVSNPKPVTQQIAIQTLDFLEAQGCPIERLGVDDSGTQSVADAIEVEWFSRHNTRRKVHRVSFGASPSERPCSTIDVTPANKKYRDKVTELWYTFAEFGRFNQIRGLNAECVNQFTSRRLAEGKRPLRLEDKKAYKKRSKRSPDDADAVACMVSVVREVLGYDPGSSDPDMRVPTPGGTNLDEMHEEAVKRNSLTFSSDFSDSSLDERDDYR